MDALVLTAALVLAGVFGVAGIAKLRDRAGTRTAVRAFGAPESLVAATAVVLPVAELAVAGALVHPATRALGAAGALGLLALFSAAIAASLARGRTPECHCFGQLHSAPASWKTLARNGALGAIAAGLLAAWRSDVDPAPWGWIAARSAAELGLTAAALAATTIVIAAATALLALMRAYGRVLVRLEATEQALHDAGIELPGDADAELPELGLDPGTPAPQFMTQLSDGRPVTRDDLLADVPLLLVFTSPSCGPCHALMPAVARWQRELGDRLTVAVASAGELEAIHGLEAEHGLAPMLVDTDLALSDAHLTTGTPSGVLIAPDGAIASYVAAGAEEIEALVDRVVSPPREAGLPMGADAPAPELHGVDGSIALVDPDGRETLVLFWNPGCGYCQELRPAILAWEQDPPPGAPRLLVVSSGTAEETAADAFRSTVAFDPEFAVGTAFQAGGTPMAVVVDGQGKVASPLAAGGDAVRFLLAASASGVVR